MVYSSLQTCVLGNLGMKTDNLFNCFQFCQWYSLFRKHLIFSKLPVHAARYITFIFMYL